MTSLPGTPLHCHDCFRPCIMNMHHESRVQAAAATCTYFQSPLGRARGTHVFLQKCHGVSVLPVLVRNFENVPFRLRSCRAERTLPAARRTDDVTADHGCGGHDHRRFLPGLRRCGRQKDSTCTLGVQRDDRLIGSHGRPGARRPAAKQGQSRGLPAGIALASLSTIGAGAGSSFGATVWGKHGFTGGSGVLKFPGPAGASRLSFLPAARWS